MVAFDQDRWEKRTLKRYEADLASLSAQRRALALGRYESNSNAIGGLRVVVEWASARGFTVDFIRGCVGGAYVPGERKITVSSRARPEVQLHFLLHECGHLLIGKREEGQRYGAGYTSATADAEPKNFRYRLDVIDEELEAWHRGKKLAARLDVTLNDEAYEFNRCEAMKTYVKWAVGADGY